jgi:hypothetical protein
MAEYLPETHVYLDESACNRHTSNRSYAWAPLGDRARRHDYFVRGIRCVFESLYCSRVCIKIRGHGTGILFFLQYLWKEFSTSTS